MGLRVTVVQAVHVLDERQAGAAEALRQQVGPGVTAVRREAAGVGRVLPQRVGRVADEDDAGDSVHEEGQEVAEDLRRNGYDAMGG